MSAIISSGLAHPQKTRLQLVLVLEKLPNILSESLTTFDVMNYCKSRLV